METMKRPKNSRLTFLSILISVASLLIPNALFFLGRADKRLTCELITRTTIANVDEIGIPRLSVVYGDSTLSKASLIVMRIENSGDIPVERSDFEGPIRFQKEGCGADFVGRSGRSIPTISETAGSC